MSDHNLTRAAILTTMLVMGLIFFANQAAPATASSSTQGSSCSYLKSYFQTHSSSSNKVMYSYYQQNCLNQSNNASDWQCHTYGACQTTSSSKYTSNYPSCQWYYYGSCYSESNYVTQYPSCYYDQDSYSYNYNQYSNCLYYKQGGSYYYNYQPCYYQSCSGMYGYNYPYGYSYNYYPSCYGYDCYGYQYPGYPYGYSNSPSTYSLTVITDPPNVASVSGSGNYTKGTSASFAVSQSVIDASPNTRYVFSHWSGDYSGNEKSGSITIDASKRVTAVYQIQYQLSVSAQPTNAPLPQGSGWYNTGDSVTLTPPNQMVGGEDGTRLVFSGWNIDGTNVQTNTSLQIKMDSAHAVTAVYKTQYYLKVLTDQGTASGEDWYDAGTNANIYVSNPQSPSFGVQPVFNGWAGDLNSNTQSATVNMDKPKTVIASWHNDYTLLYLTIGGVIAALVLGTGTLAYASTRRRSGQVATTQLPTQRITENPASATQTRLAGSGTDEQGDSVGSSNGPTGNSVRCVSCGREVGGPAKEWDMHPKNGRGPALHIKHYSCPQCGTRFRLATKLAGA